MKPVILWITVLLTLTCWVQLSVQQNQLVISSLAVVNTKTSEITRYTSEQLQASFVKNATASRLCQGLGLDADSPNRIPFSDVDALLFFIKVGKIGSSSGGFFGSFNVSAILGDSPKFEGSSPGVNLVQPIFMKLGSKSKVDTDIQLTPPVQYQVFGTQFQNTSVRLQIVYTVGGDVTPPELFVRCMDMKLYQSPFSSANLERPAWISLLLLQLALMFYVSNSY